MNESETRAELVDPALRSAGWGVVEASKVRREVITLGRLQGGGIRAAQDIADYVLVFRNQKLAVIEAKRVGLGATEGVAQAKKYAEKLQCRFAYSTNGEQIYVIDMQTGVERYVERYPTPGELWESTFEETNFWRERFADVPFEDKGGQWQARYYQDLAISKTLEAVANGRNRILLNLATGTGKTFVAFQLAWKLYESRWNKTDSMTAIQSGRRPRILFLADRNILADQAYNSFSAFDEDALVRIDPQIIRKRGKVPKNGNIFFTIFQTFMSGKNSDGQASPSFGDYPTDFFDFVIIDECHRGGANDESSWRSILEYFSSAVQLGLTATPKRQVNVDTYSYFGEPVYSYSLKDGINDGFLTPFKVKQIATTLDEYVYTADDELLAGDIEEGKRYTEKDFNRIIEIAERERYRVKLFMDAIGENEKTIVFCATQDHALAVRDLINQYKKSSAPNFCVRVTANDGSLGEQFLRVFQDNEKIIPTILTTSFKLSTGVDARNVRNIVLMRPIKTMIEFKQIIGRGTRLYDGKNYFTIFDFVRAYEHFNDPEWDGEPMEPAASRAIVASLRQGRIGDTDEPGDLSEPEQFPERSQKLKIKLADGKERAIQHMMATTFWSSEGAPISAAQFITRLFGELPSFFKNEDELRALWSQPESRTALIESLAERGYGSHELREIEKMINVQTTDLYDVLAYIGFALVPLTRQERADLSRPFISAKYSPKLQIFLNFVLSQYVLEGVGELDQSKLPRLLELKYQAVADAALELGGIANIREAFVDFQQYLYR